MFNINIGEEENNKGDYVNVGTDDDELLMHEGMIGIVSEALAEENRKKEYKKQMEIERKKREKEAKDKQAWTYLFAFIITFIIFILKGCGA